MHDDHVLQACACEKSQGGLKHCLRKVLASCHDIRSVMERLGRPGTYQGNKLTCNSSGNARQQLPQLTEPL